MKRLSALLIALLPVFCLADSVVPIDKVKKSVNVRLSPDASSEIVGRLDQGDSMVLVSSEAGWHEVALEGGATGYISADWTIVVSDEAPIAESTPVEAVQDASVDAVEGTVVAELPTGTVAERADTVVAELPTGTVAEGADTVVAAEVVIVPEVEEVIVAVAEIPEPIAEPDPEPAPEIAPVLIPETAPEPAVAPIAFQGTENFLIKFRDKNKSGSSQIFDNGNQIGIGTMEPKQRLEVNGSIQIHEQNSSVAGLMITQATGDTGYIMHNRASTLTIGAGSQDRITIDRDGNVGIAVSRPNHPLEMASGAYVSAGGAWTNSSSRANKENIVSLSGDQATSTVMALQPVLFNYKTELAEDYVGFIAEDVPDLVATRDRDSLSTMDIVAVLTRVVQEQQVRIEELEARLDAQ